MVRFLTAGESHGPSLVCIIEGLPAGLRISPEGINAELKRRQHAPGRGARMQIEDDKVVVLAGLRGGYTLGSPIALQITNKDFVNWQDKMDPQAPPAAAPITAPRPGHADYPGAVKYGFKDIRNVIERASARETAMRTAVGAVAKQVLAAQGVEIYSRVLQLGPIGICGGEATLEEFRKGLLSNYGLVDGAAEERAQALIASCRASNASVGGIIEVVAFNLPVGLGSYVHYDRRLDGQVAQSLMSIPGVKGVEIGNAFDAARNAPGVSGDSLQLTESGEITYLGNTNGGLTGGVTTGQPLVARCAVKPIPTAMPSQSIDLLTLEPVAAVKERSDVTMVPAVRVIAENLLAWTLLTSMLTDGPQANNPLFYPPR